MKDFNFEIDDAFIKNLTEIFKEEKKEVECPPVELIIAYAFDDLEGEIKEIVRDHINYCTECLDLVLSLRAADERAKNTPPVKMPDKLLKLIESTEEKKVSSKVIAVQFKKDLEIEEEKIKKWFETTPEYNFALAAKDAEKGRKIVLKIVERPETHEERVQFYEMEIMDESYDSGMYYLTAKVSVKFTFENLIGCFGEWKENEKTKNYMASQCRYDPETGLINFSFEVNEIPEGKIEQVIILCKE